MNNYLYPTISWIKEDWRSDKFRFCIEILAWGISVGCSLAMALTVPNPPLIIIYPFWIVGCCMYAWASYTRRSFGMLANYMLLVSIDCVGLSRIVLNNITGN